MIVRTQQGHDIVSIFLGLANKVALTFSKLLAILDDESGKMARYWFMVYGFLVNDLSLMVYGLLVYGLWFIVYGLSFMV